MNKDTAKDFLPLVQALADGKTIQIFHPSRHVWGCAKNPHFTYGLDHYRIKPEPREWKACVSTSRHEEPGLLFHYDEGDEDDPKYEVIRVLEILD